MKKIIIIIASLLFSLLFYKQSTGLNFLIFTLITILVLSINDFSKIKKRNTLLLSIIYLVSGCMIFLYNTQLNIITNVIIFLSLVGSYSEHKSSLYIKWINGLYSTIVSSAAHYFDGLDSEIKNAKKKEINYFYWFKIIGIPTIVLIIFINLYREANSLFDEIISKIDLSFINLQWILFAGLGYYLFNNIIKPIQIEPVTVNDINTGNKLFKNSLKKENPKKLESEIQLGTILISLLNLLIVFFLITDIYSLVANYNDSAFELSKQVHNGTNTLIISILLAIAIIIYFFRGDLNFYTKNKLLKSLTYLWIFLNIILAFITTYKNYQYSSIYGFTYKRIGVFVYLFLTLFGLITTFIKVKSINNLWYLFRKNTQIAFVLLIISSTINWDKLITYHTLNYVKSVDMDYLFSLTDNNTFVLKDYAEKNNINTSTKENIDRRHSKYIQKLNENSWQEMTYDNLKIKND